MQETSIDVKTMEQALLYSMDEMIRSFQVLLQKTHGLVPPIPKIHVPKQARILVDNIAISIGFDPTSDVNALPAVHVTFLLVSSDRTFPQGYVLPQNKAQSTANSLSTRFLRGLSIYPNNVNGYPQDIHRILVGSCKLHPARLTRVISYIDYYSQWAQKMTSRIPDIHRKAAQQEAQAIEQITLLASLRHIR